MIDELIFFYLTRPLLLREVIRKSSPVPFTGFAEVLHARQCSNAFDIALAGTKIRPQGVARVYLTQ